MAEASRIPPHRLSKEAQRRLILAVVFFVGLAIVAALMLVGLRDGVAFFRTPSSAWEEPEGRFFRLGGFVEPGTLKKSDDGYVSFLLSDGQMTMEVQFPGALPALFTEGSGAVAEGKRQGNLFLADRLFARHDESYVPRELAECFAVPDGSEESPTDIAERHRQATLRMAENAKLPATGKSEPPC